MLNVIAKKKDHLGFWIFSRVLLRQIERRARKESDELCCLFLDSDCTPEALYEVNTITTLRTLASGPPNWEIKCE